MASGVISEKNILFPKLQRQALSASEACPPEKGLPRSRGGMCTPGQEGPEDRQRDKAEERQGVSASQWAGLKLEVGHKTIRNEVLHSPGEQT